MKEMNIADLYELDDELYKEQKEIIFKDLVIKIDKKFRPTKMEKVMLEFLKLTGDLTESDKTNKSHNIYWILLIKYFTSIPVPENARLPQLLSIFETIIDIGIFELLHTEDGFEKCEVENLVNRANAFASYYAKSKEMLQEEMAKMMLENESK